MKFKLLYLFISITILLQTGLYSNNKSIGAAFLTVNPSAAATGRGGAGVAYGESALDIFHNPALAIKLNNHSLGFTHIELLSNANFEYLSYIYELFPRVRIGGDFTYVNNNDVRRDANGSEQGTIYNRDYAGSVITAYQLEDNISIGARLRYIKQQLDMYHDITWGLDAGVLFEDVILHNLNLGLSIKNIGGDITFINLADKMPLTFEAGLKYDILENRLRILADVYKPRDMNTEGSVGFEYEPFSLLVLRTGFKMYEGAKTENSLRFGIGLKRKNWNFDYAYEYYDNLGTTHWLTYGINFGKAYAKTKEGLYKSISKKYMGTFSIERVVNLSYNNQSEWLTDGLREIVKHYFVKQNWKVSNTDFSDIMVDLSYIPKDKNNVTVNIDYSLDGGNNYRTTEINVNMNTLFDDMQKGIDEVIRDAEQSRKK